jgi:MTH538 TIR-like domain (DUF1863)
MDDRIYDLFITHAWRYHEDWTRMGNMLDKFLGDAWRNFSVPWYDPALDPNTEIGSKLIHQWLGQQIAPVCGVIVLSSVFENKSARKWVELEAQLARTQGKPLIGIPTFGTNDIAPGAAALVDEVCPWDAERIVGAINTRYVF